MINVFIADDHQIVIDGMKLLLEQEIDICTVGEALNGKELLEKINKSNVDIAIVDIEMPEMDGFETTISIKEQHPDIKVLILTMYNEHDYINRLISIGASGYILKNKGKEELVEAIRKIYAGGEYFGEAIVNTLISEIKKPKKKEQENDLKLTKREKEVLELITQGHTTPEISEKLFIAPSTVETHRRNLIDKTGVSNSKILIKYAIENGYLNQ